MFPWVLGTNSGDSQYLYPAGHFLRKPGTLELSRTYVIQEFLNHINFGCTCLPERPVLLGEGHNCPCESLLVKGEEGLPITAQLPETWSASIALKLTAKGFLEDVKIWPTQTVTCYLLVSGPHLSMGLGAGRVLRRERPLVCSISLGHTLLLRIPPTPWTSGTSAGSVCTELRLLTHILAALDCDLG